MPSGRAPRPGLLDTVAVVSRSWTGAVVIAAVAVAATGSCRSDMTAS